MRDSREPVPNLNLVGQLLVVLVVALVAPLVLGILLDRLLQTSPLVTLFLLVLGTTLGTVAVYREVNAVYDRVAGGKEK